MTEILDYNNATLVHAPSVAANIAAFEFGLLGYTQLKDNNVIWDDTLNAQLDLRVGGATIRHNTYMDMVRYLSPRNFPAFKAKNLRRIDEALQSAILSDVQRQLLEREKAAFEKATDYASLGKELGVFQDYTPSAVITQSGIESLKDERLAQINTELKDENLSAERREWLEKARNLLNNYDDHLSSEQVTAIAAALDSQKRAIDTHYNLTQAYAFGLLNFDAMQESKQEVQNLYADVVDAQTRFIMETNPRGGWSAVEQFGRQAVDFFCATKKQEHFCRDKANEILGSWQEKLDGRVQAYQDAMMAIENSPNFKLMCQYFMEKEDAKLSSLPHNSREYEDAWILSGIWLTYQRGVLMRWARDKGLIPPEHSYANVKNLEQAGDIGERLQQSLQQLHVAEDEYDFLIACVTEFQEACRQNPELLKGLAQRANPIIPLQVGMPSQDIIDSMKEVRNNFEDRLMRRGETSTITYNAFRDGVSLGSAWAVTRFSPYKGMIAFMGTAAAVGGTIDLATYGLQNWSITAEGCKKVQAYFSSPEFTEYWNEEELAELNVCVAAYSKMAEQYEAKTAALPMNDFDFALEYALRHAEGNHYSVLQGVKRARDLEWLKQHHPKEYQDLWNRYEKLRDDFAETGDMGIASRLAELGAALNGAETGQYFYYAQQALMLSEAAETQDLSHFVMVLDEHHNPQENQAMQGLMTVQQAAFASAMEYTNCEMMLSAWQRGGRPKTFEEENHCETAEEILEELECEVEAQNNDNANEGTQSQAITSPNNGTLMANAAVVSQTGDVKMEEADLSTVKGLHRSC